MRKFAWIVLCLCLLCPRAKAEKPPVYGDLRDSVDFQLHTVKQTLTSDRTGIVYLEVVNNSNDSLYLTVSSESPDYLRVEGDSNRMLLAPRNSLVLNESLVVAKRISPGTCMVVYKLRIVSAKSGRTATHSKVITQEVEIGILGESGIMTILGLNVFSVPFFLILPGFLFVVIWAAFLPPVYKAQQALLAPEKKEPFFWVAAITLSLVFTYLYSLISRLTVWTGYGLLDVIWLWVGSISLAIVGIFILNVILRIKARKEAAKDFTRNDSPLKVLDRLQKRGAGCFLDQGSSTGAAGLLFDLGNNQLPAAEAAIHWYAYGIFAKKTDSVQQGSKEEAIYNQLVKLIRDLDADPASCDLATLIHRLRDAEKSKAITLEFDHSPGIVSPLAADFVVKARQKNIVHT